MKRLLTIENNIKYILPFEPGDRLLIIAPHPDDETIGCGGIIRKLLSLSVNIDIALVTYGGNQKTPNIIDIRKKEFCSAKSILGNINAIYLGYEDSKLSKNFEFLCKDISKLICSTEYNGILVPYVLDYNIDHQVCNYSLSKSLKENITTITYIAMYEVWTPILYPNYYINISEEFDIKCNALRCYRTQEDYFHIIRKAKLLNSLRAELSMRFNLRYMECFKGFQKSDYIDIVEECRISSNRW